MAQLTANQVNTYDSVPQERNTLPVNASAEIFKGSAVGLTAGYARQLVAADIFGGFAEQHVLEASGTNGGALVPVLRTGVIQAAITGAVVGDINKAVYMSDGNTFTYTSSSNTLIGRVIRFESAGVVMVEFSVKNQAAS
jgi:hypothetical protein